jgi:hypothetical protein
MNWAAFIWIGVHWQAAFKSLMNVMVIYRHESPLSLNLGIFKVINANTYESNLQIYSDNFLH